MTINDNNRSYLIYENTLHAFNLPNVFQRLHEGRIKLDNVKRLKIWACRNIFSYNSYWGINLVREHHVFWDESLYSYNYQMLCLIEAFYQATSTDRRVTIITNENDTSMKKHIDLVLEDVETLNLPRPIIEKYQCQYVNDYHPETVYCEFRDKGNDKRCRKVMLELTKDSTLYVSLVPDNWYRQPRTNRNNPVVADTYLNGRVLCKDNGIITVEDYVKWYNLYRIHLDESKNVVVTKDVSDEILSTMEIEWHNDSPIPKSVVEQCIKHDVKLGYASFLTILCMYAEEVAECDPLDLDESCIPPIEDLAKVLVQDYGYCEYFGTAKLVSVAKKFGLQSLATFNYNANRFKI